MTIKLINKVSLMLLKSQEAVGKVSGKTSDDDGAGHLIKCSYVNNNSCEMCMPKTASTVSQQNWHEIAQGRYSTALFCCFVC